MQGTAFAAPHANEHKTLSQPTRGQPFPKEVLLGAHNSRIVLISPYALLNQLLKTLVPRLIKGGHVDELMHAQTDLPPYVNVDERERHAYRPFWVIDFRRIIVYHGQQLPRKEAVERVVQDYAAHLSGPQPDTLASALEGAVNEDLAGRVSTELQNGFAMHLRRNLLRELLRTDSQKVPHVVPFNGYQEWCVMHRPSKYVTPTERFAKTLLGLERCVDGAYDPASVVVSDALASVLSYDLEMIKRGTTTALKVLQIRS